MNLSKLFGLLVFLERADDGFRVGSLDDTNVGHGLVNHLGESKQAHGCKFLVFGVANLQKIVAEVSFTKFAHVGELAYAIVGVCVDSALQFSAVLLCVFYLF